MGKRKDLEKKTIWDEQYKKVNRVMSNFRHQKLRRQFFGMYGGKCVCPKCSETNEWFLTLDHINNDGYIARSKGKYNLSAYRDAIKEYRPDLYRTLCFNCNCAKDKNGGICPHFRVSSKVLSRKTKPRKLTSQQVIEVCKRYKRWDRIDGVRAIAKDFSVCAETIENIVREDFDKIRKNRSAKAKIRRRRTKEQFLKMYGQVCNCPGCTESNQSFLTLDHINNDGAGETSLKAYKQAVQQYNSQAYQVLCYNCNCSKNRNNNICPHIKITKKKHTKITNERHKLNMETIKQIRQRHRQYSRSDGTHALAREFGVATSTIEDIVYNRSWKDI